MRLSPSTLRRLRQACWLLAVAGAGTAGAVLVFGNHKTQGDYFLACVAICGLAQVGYFLIRAREISREIKGGDNAS